MQYPLWKEEVIPDLIFGNEDEDFELLKGANGLVQSWLSALSPPAGPEDEEIRCI